MQYGLERRVAGHVTVVIFEMWCRVALHRSNFVIDDRLAFVVQQKTAAD